MTERVQRRKDALRESIPEICIDRARLVTEAYGMYKNEPAVILKAKVTRYVLEHMEIDIRAEELIVGNHASTFRSAPVFPEYGAQWMVDEIDEFATRETDPLRISKENKVELLNILEGWKGQGFAEQAEQALSKEVLEAERSGVLTVGSRITSTGHVVPNYGKLIQLGYRGVITEAKGRLEEIGLRTHENQSKVDFLNAVIISNEGAIAFAQRFADRAEAMAKEEKNSNRQLELEKISKICRRIPEEAPQTFWEGLQFVWFTHLIIQIETNGHSIGLGRFDQYLYSLYQKSIESGELTKEDAVELIQMLWLKITELLKVRDGFNAQAFAGYPMWQNVAIAGQTPEGEDASNPLSMAMLEAFEGVQTTQPSPSFRYHDNIDPNVLDKALTLTQKGLAMPAFFNDKLVIPMMLAKGASIEDARDWSIEGCVEPFVSGKSDGRPVVGYINGIKLLELILNDGVDPLTGKQIGLKTGDASSYKSLEDIMIAFEKQLHYFIRLMLEGYNVVGALHSTRMPAPFASSTVDDCIQKARSLQEGGAKYNFSSTFITALANTVDALAAIDYAVFKEEILSLAELNDILKINFEGQKNIQALLINKPPKYGNDHDEVDLLAKRIVAMYNKELEHYRDSRGGRYILSVLSSSFNVLQGKCVGASADGRYAFEALSDNGSPAAGRDVEGPTAVIKSVSKIDQMQTLAGTLFNLKLDPVLVRGDEGRKRIHQIIRAYFDLLGEHIQINVTDSAVLREAQQSPENHRNIMVRVAGYSAYFVELDPDVQENIILRTSHG
ncbi:formate C-acetyltransferase/glycerol dehydratase family glycyl radical enzyme [Wukongibacter baidiensis]|uniref:glycyl radical protein n=1 Tax=Wukongibacter baidiensis TaxID=1723361 RepID=UPI003D7F8521